MPPAFNDSIRCSPRFASQRVVYGPTGCLRGAKRGGLKGRGRSRPGRSQRSPTRDDQRINLSNMDLLEWLGENLEKDGSALQMLKVFARAGTFSPAPGNCDDAIIAA